MASATFYFRGLSDKEVQDLRKRLNEIAGEMGYVARWGPTQGEGNAAALMIAIARGEVAVFRVGQALDPPVEK